MAGFLTAIMEEKGILGEVRPVKAEIPT